MQSQGNIDGARLIIIMVADMPAHGACSGFKTHLVSTIRDVLLLLESGHEDVQEPSTASETVSDACTGSQTTPCTAERVLTDMAVSFACCGFKIHLVSTIQDVLLLLEPDHEGAWAEKTLHAEAVPRLRTAAAACC